MDIRPEVNISQPPEEGLEWSMAAHLREVADEALHSPWPEIIGEYGAVDAWLDHCRQRRRADGDRALARIVMTLMYDAPGRPRGPLFPADRAKLLADRPLAAYFASVVAGGDAAWEETRRAAGDIYAVKARLPTWRQWGALLLEAGAVGDLDVLFVPPKDVCNP